MFRRIASSFTKRLRLQNNPKVGLLSDRNGYETVYDDDAITVYRIAGQQENCIISFTGVGHALGGIDLQSPEFSRATSNETKIFVIDKHRSWGNNIDWENLNALLGRLSRGAKITTLGNSMGGFLAILAARRLGATHAIAFSPQWSIDPIIVPEEKRWEHYRKNIRHIHHPDLTGAFDMPTKFFIFFGNNQCDEIHLRFFKQVSRNLDLFTIEGGGHNVAAHLNETGQLYPAINACRTGCDVRRLLKENKIRLVGD